MEVDIVKSDIPLLLMSMDMMKGKKMITRLITMRSQPNCFEVVVVVVVVVVVIVVVVVVVVVVFVVVVVLNVDVVA